MASVLLRPIMRPQIIGLGLGLSMATFHVVRQRPLRMDTASVLSSDSYSRHAQTPIMKKEGGLNPAAVRQISGGSIAGLVAGLAVSTFSRSLALLIGLLVVGVQWAASYGINVLPYKKLQKYVTSMDLRSAVQDNIAFKMSFGTTFAMAAFMHF